MKTKWEHIDMKEWMNELRTKNYSLLFEMKLDFTIRHFDKLQKQTCVLNVMYEPYISLHHSFSTLYLLWLEDDDIRQNDFWLVLLIAFIRNKLML